MSSILSERADRRLLTGKSISRVSAFRHLTAICAAILRRPLDAKDHKAPGYEGYAWCDSSEAQMTLDIATCRRTSLR
jgi:hypothetical protein